MPSFLTRFMGAAKSGNRAAYLGILLKGLRPLTLILDSVLARKNAPYKHGTSLPPIVMIVSPPRSGSTITYQVLTRVIASSYLSNLHFLFPKHASSFMSSKQLFGKNMTGFKNYYGYTAKIYDVNECNEIVEDFFKDGLYPIPIRANFLAFVQRMEINKRMPIIFKNVRAYQNILSLHRAVPELIFLRIKRQTKMVIASELKAHYELGTFHPMPPELEHVDKSDAVEFCVRQILAIEESIDRQKKEIDPQVWLEWTYEEFCQKPFDLILRLIRDYLKLDRQVLRENALPDNLKANVTPHFDETVMQKIESLIHQYSANE